MNWTKNKTFFIISSRRLQSTLVLVEHSKGKISSSTLNAITAASKLKYPVTAFVAVSEEKAKDICSQVSKISGVQSVICHKDKSYTNPLAENVSSSLVAAVRDNKITHVVGPHSVFGKNILPRVAALLDVAAISDVIEIQNDSTFVRPIYAGNAIATVQSSDPIKVLTIRTTSFQAAITNEGCADIKEVVSSSSSLENVKFLKQEVAESDRPELGSAKVVIAGGRGMKNGDNFKLLYDLADKLGGAVGASRAAVDAGFVPNDLQIGQTGKIVAPKLYVAVGISGAIQHLAGMKVYVLVVILGF